MAPITTPPPPPTAPTGDAVLDGLREMAATRNPSWEVRPGLAFVDGPADTLQTYKVLTRGGVPLALGTASTVRAWLSGYPVAPPPPPDPDPESAQPPPPTPSDRAAQGSLW